MDIDECLIDSSAKCEIWGGGAAKALGAQELAESQTAGMGKSSLMPHPSPMASCYCHQLCQTG